MNLDRRLLRLIQPIKSPLTLSILTGFAAGLTVVGQAWLLSRILSGVFLAHQTLAYVFSQVGFVALLVVMRAVMTYASESSASTAAQRVKQALREKLLRHIQALGLTYVENERSGELVNTLTVGVENLDAYFSQYLPQLALAGLLPVAFLVVMVPLDPLSGLVLLLTGPLIPLFMFLIGSVSERLTQKQWRALSALSAYFLDSLQGISTLKTLGRSRERAGRIERGSLLYAQTTMKVLRVTFLSALVLELLSTMGTAVVAVEVGLRLLYARLDFQSALFFLLLAPEFYLPLRSLGLRFHASMAGVQSARRIFEVLERPLPLQKQSSAALEGFSGRQPADLTISFQNVGFVYAGREQAALQDVSFRLKAGERVALVGQSGSGKSTLARLLLRFAEPQVGQISVNGTDLSEIPIEVWREQISWVPQQPYLFHDTLAANILIARPGAALADLRQAAGQANLLDWIDSLPAGFETIIEENGGRLSGGQAQRLALARAFLRDAPLLILDEPTAHLDVDLERQFERSLAKLCERRTALIIAHRLPTALSADRVLVLQEGRLVEEGTHQELVLQGGAYCRLLNAYQGVGG